MAASTPVDEAVAQHLQRAHWWRPARRPRSRPPRPSPTAPATSGVPERTSRSCPPPCSSGTHAVSRRSSSAPTPVGPPNLCAATLIADSPLAGEVDRDLSDRLHGVAVHRNVEFGRDRGQFGDRHDGADLVVGPHHRHQRHVVVALQRLAQRGRRRPSRRVRSAARSPRRLRARRASSTASSTAWCSTAVVTMRRRRGSASRRAQ